MPLFFLTEDRDILVGLEEGWESLSCGVCATSGHYCHRGAIDRDGEAAVVRQHLS
jgi:hypothetical protein